MAQRTRIPREINPELLKLLVATGERAPSTEDKVRAAQQARSSSEASHDLDEFLIERVTRFAQAVQEAFDDGKPTVLLKAGRGVLHKEVSRVAAAAGLVEGIQLHMAVLEAE